MNHQDPSLFPEQNEHHEAALENEAAEWIIRMDRGLSPEEQTALEERLAEEPGLQELIDQSTDTWGLMTQIPAETTQQLLIKSELLPIWKQPVWRAAGLAAALVTAMLLSWAVIQGHLPGLSQPGEKGEVMAPTTRLLPDGSLARLNAGARLEVRYSDNMRQVFLNAGETHFTVQKDADRPFIVAVDHVQVTAVGTAFNVHAVSEQINVVVTEGTVQISERAPGTPGSSKLTDRRTQTADNTTTEGLVSSGQRATIRLNTVHDRIGLDMDIIGIAPKEVDEVLAWQLPLLTLEGDSLGNIAADFKEKTGQALIITDPELRNLEIGGRFPSADPKRFLEILSVNYGIDWHERKDGTLVIGSAN